MMRSWLVVCAFLVLGAPVGASWVPVGPGWSLGDVTRIAADPAGSDTVYARIETSGPGLSEWSSVYRSDDAGETWLPITGGLQDKVVTAMAVWPGQPHSIIVGTAEGLVRSEDGGHSWFFLDQDGPITSVSVAPNGRFARAALGQQGVRITRDQGRTWTTVEGLAGINIQLTMTDTTTGAINTYTNPLGTPFQPLQDTNAFRTCP